MATLTRAAPDGAGEPAGPAEAQAGAGADAERRPDRLKRLRRLSLSGALLGTAAIWASGLPSLVPRPWYIQAVGAGLSLVVAYGVGAFLGWAYRSLGLPVVPVSARKRVWQGLAVIAPIGVLVTGWLGRGWQSDQRELIGMDPSVPLLWVLGSVLGVLLAVLLLAVSRGIVWVGRRLGALLGLILPARLGIVIGAAATVVVTWSITTGFVTNVVLTKFDAVYEGRNDQTDPGVTDPRSPLRSGGPTSSVSWDSLGRQGRQFVWQAQTAEQIAAVTGDEDAKDPVRAYVGLKSTDDERGRAQIAVEELRRLGGFKRSSLAIAGATGSGWIDPRTVAALEFATHGDVATVSMQYSYLPSWLSFLVDAERARGASAELITAVRVELNAMPADERPKLYVFGESLGTNATDSAFTSVEDLSTTTDGALLVGPPGFDPTWRKLQENRDAGSPLWRPIYDQGGLVRVAANDAEVTDPKLRWTTDRRIVYLVHPSDPIVVYQGLSRSEWLDPRGPGVPGNVRNLPIVGGVQGGIDLFGANNVPPGYGHVYDQTVVTAWSEVLGPPSLPPQEVEAIQDAVRPITDPK